MNLGSGISFSLQIGGGGISFQSEIEYPPIDVAELVSSFGSSPDFDPLFRDFVSSFGFSE